MIPLKRDPLLAVVNPWGSVLISSKSFLHEEMNITLRINIKVSFIREFIVSVFFFFNMAKI